MTKEIDLLKGEIATRKHIKDVNDFLLVIANCLINRAKAHDQSKLGEEEHEKFSLAAARFKEPGNEYGSKGYEETKEWLGPALKHHYANNSHHPEFYSDGVMGMNLLDIIEMLVDWTAASKARSKDGVLDLHLNKKIHNIPDDVFTIIKNTADYLAIEYK